MERSRTTSEPRHRARRTALREGHEEGRPRRTITLAPPSATSDIWTRRFPDLCHCVCFRLDAGAGARQRGVEPPLVISRRRLGAGRRTIQATGAGEVWAQTHGQEDAVYCANRAGSPRGRLDLVRYGDEEESEAVAADEAEGSPPPEPLGTGLPTSPAATRSCAPSADSRGSPTPTAAMVWR